MVWPLLPTVHHTSSNNQFQLPYAHHLWSQFHSGSNQKVKNNYFTESVNGSCVVLYKNTIRYLYYNKIQKIHLFLAYLYTVLSQPQIVIFRTSIQLSIKYIYSTDFKLYRSYKNSVSTVVVYSMDCYSLARTAVVQL
jgi:hypothetical protein